MPGELNSFSFNIASEKIIYEDNLYLELYDENNMLQDKIKIEIDRIYYSLSVDDCGYLGNSQFEISINNDGILETDYYVSVKNALTGEIIDIIDQSNFVDYTYVYTPDFDFNENTEVVFELCTDIRNCSNNAIVFRKIKASSNIKTDNKYKGSLQAAKYIV